MLQILVGTESCGGLCVARVWKICKWLSVCAERREASDDKRSTSAEAVLDLPDP